MRVNGETFFCLLMLFALLLCLTAIGYCFVSIAQRVDDDKQKCEDAGLVYYHPNGHQPFCINAITLDKL